MSAAAAQAPTPEELAEARIGAGFAARNLCTSVFVSGRTPESVWAEELNGETSPALATLQSVVDRAAKTVTVRLPGVAEATAVWREGLGCTLAIGRSVEELRAEQAPMRAMRASRAPWPKGDGPDRRPLPRNVDKAALERVLDEAFAKPAEGRDPRTRAVVVVHKGRIVAERYAPGYDASTAQYGASMSKTATNALVGLRVRDGKLSLAETGVAPEWRAAGDPRAAITLDQLMHMSSGLVFNEEYGGVSDVNRMLFTEADAGAFAASFAPEAAPDAAFKYASGTTNIIARRVRESFGGDEAAYRDFLRNALFARLGMRSAVFETDTAGTFVGSSLLYASARDWARLGLLYLQDGVWEGERLLPEGWARYTAIPAPAAKELNYGAQVWLDGANGRDEPAPVMIMSGFGGQSVTVVPAADTVIVRLGWQLDRSAWSEKAFRTKVLRALGYD